MTTYYPQDRREEDWIDINEKAAHVNASAPPTTPMDEAAEMLWIVLANVSGGDWTKQSKDWQEAAARWRDNYFAAVKAASVPAAPPAPTAGDLYLAKVEAWSDHAESCELDECAECDALLNQFRLARKVWRSSSHQLVTEG